VSFADLIAKKSGAGCECEEYPDAGLPEPSRSGLGSLESFIQKHSHVSEEYKFYNGEITIRFNKEEHCYYRVADLGNLIPLNGVTNTVGIIDKSFMLTPWAAKMAIQKLLRIMPTEMVDGIIRIKHLTFEEFTVIALEAKGAHKEKLDEAGDIGHMAHKCLEDSINFAMQNDPDKIVRQLINIPADELAANAASAALSWMRQHNVRWVETERKVYSRTYDFAGTTDGLAWVDACEDRSCCPEEYTDHLAVVDWKSSNNLHTEYCYQTAAYLQALIEEFKK
jgi:hypothetical protein